MQQRRWEDSYFLNLFVRENPFLYPRLLQRSMSKVLWSYFYIHKKYTKPKKKKRKMLETIVIRNSITELNLS